MTREWDFGDTEKSEDKNPFHCYQYPGVYSVSLKKEYPDGEQNVTKNDYITVYAVPRPLLAVNPPNGYAPLRITATDNTAGYESKRFWDFGDGTYESAARVEHEYDDEGVQLSPTVWGEGRLPCHCLAGYPYVKTGKVRYDLSGLPRRSAPTLPCFQVKGSPYQWSIEFGDGIRYHLNSIRPLLQAQGIQPCCMPVMQMDARMRQRRIRYGDPDEFRT